MVSQNRLPQIEFRLDLNFLHYLNYVRFYDFRSNHRSDLKLRVTYNPRPPRNQSGNKGDRDFPLAWKSYKSSRNPISTTGPTMG